MKIKDIMTADTQVISPDSVLEEAAQKMKAADIGSLPVYDGRELIGMLTDRDIVIRSTARGDDPSKTHVKDVMSREICWCFGDQDLDEAVSLMEKRKIRRLPVVSREKDLLGMVSLGDIATRGNKKELAEEALDRISR